MRISIIAAGLLAGIGAAALAGPAAALPAGPGAAVAAPSPLFQDVRMVRRHMRHHRHHRRGMGPGRRFNKVTRGAPAGDSGGNAATGSTAAPSGR